LNYLDGIEANCHTKNEGPHTELVAKIASSNNKILTCGGDFHNDAPRAKCGAYLPDELSNIGEIVKYLKETKMIKLCIQENKESDSVIDYLYVNTYNL
jgi:hypothetical protein